MSECDGEPTCRSMIADWRVNIRLVCRAPKSDRESGGISWMRVEFAIIGFRSGPFLTGSCKCRNDTSFHLRVTGE